MSELIYLGCAALTKDTQLLKGLRGRNQKRCEKI